MTLTAEAISRASSPDQNRDHGKRLSLSLQQVSSLDDTREHKKRGSQSMQHGLNDQHENEPAASSSKKQGRHDTNQTTSSSGSGGKHAQKAETNSYFKPVSIWSLPYFRQMGPKLYWPPGQGETKPVLVTKESRTNPPQDFRAQRAPVGCSKKSVVYSAKFLREDGSQEQMAIKSVPLNTKHEQNIKDEFERLAAIDHNHIIAAVGMFTVDNSPGNAEIGIILFPLAPQNMDDYLHSISDHNKNIDDKGWMISPEIEKLVSYFACLCQAVMYLHELDEPIKHRDIKPPNILIDSAGTVILADFDIAKQYTSRTAAYTEGATANTRKYAPEHVKDDEIRGFDWDVAGLGFVFLEMASVMMGETMDNLDKAMKGEEYSVALAHGHISVWIQKLKADNAKREDTKWPRNRFCHSGPEKVETIVDDFFKHIMSMMQAKPTEDKNDTQNQHNRPRNIEVLRQAWSCFAKLCEHECTHCHPKRRRTLLKPPSVGSPKIPTRSPLANIGGKADRNQETSIRRGPALERHDISVASSSKPATVYPSIADIQEESDGVKDLPTPKQSANPGPSLITRRAPTGLEDDEVLYQEPSMMDVSSRPSSPRQIRFSNPVSFAPEVEDRDSIDEAERTTSPSGRSRVPTTDRASFGLFGADSLRRSISRRTSEGRRYSDKDIRLRVREDRMSRDEVRVIKGWRVIQYDRRTGKFSLIKKSTLLKSHINERSRLRGDTYVIPESGSISIDDPVLSVGRSIINPRRYLPYRALIAMHWVTWVFVPDIKAAE